MTTRTLIAIACLLILITGCRTTELTSPDREVVHRSDISKEELLALLPDNRDSLDTISGSGRVSLSEPGNSETVNVDFHSDRESSLVTLKSRIGGIEGAQILVHNDSVLVYNRIEETAEKTSLYNENLTQIGSLATINLVNLMSFTISADDISRIYENENVYVTVSSDGLRVTIDKTSGLITHVEAFPTSGAPYGEIIYEQYGQLDGFTLPRRITVFSKDGQSRALFLIRELETNRLLPPMRLSIPEETPVQIL